MNYIVKQSDFDLANKHRKCDRWIQWAVEIGLKPGDRWNAVDYMLWVDAHITYDR